MRLYNNFQKGNLLKKIENGRVSETDIASLLKLLDNDPKMIPEVVGTINSILQKGDIKAYNSAILALNKMAENYIGLSDYSVEVIVSCMQKRKNDLFEDGMSKILEILLKIALNYPGHMKIAVPELMKCLENTNATSRETAHYTLSLLAATNHEYFRDQQKEINRVLNGLNVDERIYACRLIMKLAEKERTIVEDTYDLLEDLRLNHPDSKLRSEAGFAIEKLERPVKGNLKEPVKEKLKKPVNGKLRKSVEDKHSKVDIWSINTIPEPELSYNIKDRTGSSDNFAVLAELMTPNKEDLVHMLEGMSLEHLIVNR
jgi:hypothetical protein